MCINVLHLSSFHTAELNHFVIDLDEEVVGMQSTICALQQQLKEAKQELAIIKQTPQKSSTDSSSEVAASNMPPPAPVEPVVPPDLSYAPKIYIHMEYVHSLSLFFIHKHTFIFRGLVAN